MGGAGPAPVDDSSPAGVPAPGGHAGRSANCGGGGGYAGAFVTGCVRCGPTRSVGLVGEPGPFLACPCFLHPAGPLSSRRQTAEQGPGGRSRVGRNSVQTWRRVVGTARGVGARRPVWARFAPHFGAATVRVAKRGRFCPAGESGQGAWRVSHPDQPGSFLPGLRGVQAGSVPPGPRARVSWPAKAASGPRRWRRVHVGGVGPAWLGPASWQVRGGRRARRGRCWMGGAGPG